MPYYSEGAPESGIARQNWSFGMNNRRMIAEVSYGRVVNEESYWSNKAAICHLRLCLIVAAKISDQQCLMLDKTTIRV